MKLSVEGKFRLAVKSALLLGLTAGASAAHAQEAASSEPVELEKVEVTGSRLKRADVEGAVPVTVINREQIELAGDMSVADLLRNMSFNTFGSFRQQSGNTWQSVATIDLRGLGAERTLVLIDGKRAPKHPSTGSVQDLNVVPLAAVERIELLQDGASAIYGSDAIGGVVNVILRSDFQGAEIMYGEGNPSSITGGDTREGSVLMGLSNDKGNVILGASFNSRDIIYTRDMIYGYVPGASLYSNNYLGIESGTFAAIPDGCDDPGFTLNTDTDPETDDVCTFDFASVAADEASTKTQSLFAKGRYQISDDWSFYTTATISRSESFGRYAPVAAYFFVPEEAASNPFGEDIYVYHRFAALGNRDNQVEGTNTDLLGGFEGKWGMFNFDVGARYGHFKVYDIGRNYSVKATVEKYAADGTYDFVNPLNNSDDVLNAMKATISRISTWDTKEAWGSVSFDAFQMAGGMAGFAFGAEYRSEDYSDQYDSLSEAGQIGGSSGNSAGGGRNMRALFAEGLFPILNNLEASVALRYDDYSDYGNDTSPKLSLRYQPLDALTVRASYGQGFRAPTLDILTAKPAFSAEPITNDPATCLFIPGNTFNETTQSCSKPVQVNATSISNPNLSSETSDQYTLGIAADPVSWLNFAVDYYNIKIEDTISQFSPEYLVSLDTAGQDLPPGFSITRDPNSGRITGLVYGLGNRGTLETDGIDANVETIFKFGALGRLANQLQLTYVNKYEVSTDSKGDLVGEPGVPEMRGTLFNTWNVNDFSASYSLNYIADTAASASGTGVRAGHIGSWITHDVQLNYESPWKARLTIGINNVGDKQPPLVSYDGRPYNFYLYDAYGQVPYFRYTQRF